MNLYKTHSEGYYTAVSVPKELFDKIPERMVIKPLNNIKFLLGNKKETEFLESIGVFSGDGMLWADYYKVYCDER